jgi:integrase
MAPPRRRVNGEGTITRRADSRWMGRFYAWTTAGTRKRITVYGHTRQQVTERIRLIAVHHLRHTIATLLKNLGVPARDVQIILGHSRLAVTLEIYTHEDRQAQREALGKISDALRRDGQNGQ